MADAPPLARAALYLLSQPARMRKWAAPEWRSWSGESAGPREIMTRHRALSGATGRRRGNERPASYMLHAPDFWGESGASGLVLSPLSALYGAVARYRLARAARPQTSPAIAIGGLDAGRRWKNSFGPSAGPVLMGRRASGPSLRLAALAARKTGEDPPFVVDPARQTARMRRRSAVIGAHGADHVGADRAASARLAQTLGAGALILDDGLHSRRLDPDLAILVVDADYGAGNGFCRPPARCARRWRRSWPPSTSLS